MESVSIFELLIVAVQGILGQGGCLMNILQRDTFFKCWNLGKVYRRQIRTEDSHRDFCQLILLGTEDRLRWW